MSIIGVVLYLLLGMVIGGGVLVIFIILMEGRR